MSASNTLLYLLRRDLRVADNPILHHLATTTDHGFTHFLPIYVFPAHQIEVSGLVRNGAKSPYPEARSQVGGYWRCGPHRVKFTAQSVWNLKESLHALGSGLILRAGMYADVIQHVIEGLAEKEQKVGAVWMVGEESVEEKRDEKAIAALCEKHGIEFKIWMDEKYFIDE
jgi:deoxyribodipyrimidine photo-lyase